MQELKGKRRPFPPLYKAKKQYGDRIFYAPPEYVQKGHCRYCGKEVGEGRRSFCSDLCRELFANATVWCRGRDPYSLRILYRDNFTCQECGTFHAQRNKNGVFMPIDDGQLNVHHIVPVSEGGGDEPENLVTLCVECHKETHRRLRNAEK